MGMLDSLLGASQYPVGPNGVDPLAPLQGDPTQVPLQGQQVAGTSLTPGAPTPAQPVAPNPNAPIVISGGPKDQWHPHHRTLLGTVADFALAALGFPIFPFGHHNENQNVHEAMQGFQQNPRQAISRLAQIAGHEDDAAKLAGQEDDSDTKNANLARQNSVLELQAGRYKDARDLTTLDRLAAIAGSVKDPATWEAAKPMMQKIAASREFNIDDMPQDYDHAVNWINGLRSGATPVAKQFQIDTANRKESDLDAYRNRKQTDMEHFHNGELALGGARVGIAGRNANTEEFNAQTSRQRADQELREFNAKYGQGTSGTLNGEDYVISANGNTMLRRHNKQGYIYVKGSNKAGKTIWVLQGPAKGTDNNAPTG